MKTEIGKRLGPCQRKLHYLVILTRATWKKLQVKNQILAIYGQRVKNKVESESKGKSKGKSKSKSKN